MSAEVIHVSTRDGKLSTSHPDWPEELRAKVELEAAAAPDLGQRHHPRRCVERLLRHKIFKREAGTSRCDSGHGGSFSLNYLLNETAEHP